MKKLVLILTFLALPLSSYAQEAIYLSGMLGITSIESSNENTAALEPAYKSELSYGLRGGLLFNDHISAGLFVQQAQGKANNLSGSGFDEDTTFLNIMAEFTYYFSEADENSFWVSGLLGQTKYSGDVSNGTISNSVDETATAFGASAGYHFMVAPNFSISPQVTYIRANPGDVTVDQFSGMMNVTFWL